MANWSILKAAIADVIKTNDNQEITGQRLQNILNSIVSSVGENASFAGIATPTTNPGAPDGPVFYIATQAGIYSNFDGIEVSKSEVVILKWNNGTWAKNTFKPMTDFNSVFNAEGKSLTEFESGIIYDVSAHNNNIAFESISALLSGSNLDALIPASVRHGGMSIRFIQSSDNKYVQHFLTKDEWSANVNDWEKMNLEEEVSQLGQKQISLESSILPWEKIQSFSRAISLNGIYNNNTTDSHKVIPVFGGQIVRIKRGVDNIYWAILKSYTPPTADGVTPDYADGESARLLSDTSIFEVTIPNDAKYIVVDCIFNGTDRSPSLLTIDGYDVIKGLYNNFADGAVTTPKIADGAVTKNKVGGLVDSVLRDVFLNVGYVIKVSNLSAYYPIDAQNFYAIPIGVKLINRGIPVLLASDSSYANRHDMATNETWITTNEIAFIASLSVAGNVELEVVGRKTLEDGAVTTPKIANGAVATNKIAENAITPKQTNFFVTLKNLFDYKTMLIAGKYISANGKELDNESYYCSDFIPIDETKENIVSTLYGSSGSANAFYDERMEFISSFKIQTAEIPKGAKYVRWSFPSTNIDVLKTIQVEYGTEPTPFVPFAYKIDEQYLPQSTSSDNEIIVPKYMYLLSGVNNDVFYEPILRKWNPYRYDVFANTTPNGRDYVKAIKRGVTLNNPTATGLNLSLYDLEKEDFIQTKSITFRKGTQGVGSSEIKVGIIGDSYTDGGCFTPALLSHEYVPKLKLVGTRQVTNYITQCTDGRSGWTLNTFFNVQTNVDYFNPFLHPQGSHRYWGNTAFWAGVCGGSPSGYQARYAQYASLCDAHGWPVSPLEGDVIYDSTNSSFKEYQSGSWVTVQQSDYSWEFNYSKYLSMWSIETPDILCVMLGVNDFWINSYPSEENLLVWKERMNTVIASYKASNPTGKFVILTANTVTHHNVLHYRPLDVHNRMQILREFVINEWDNKGADGIYVVDTAQLIDSENAFVLAESTPFDGFSGTSKEVYANDGQHPRLNYTTLGYSLAAFIQYMR